MILIDGAALGWIAYGVVRGRMRGLGLEVYKLLRFAAAFATGCGLHGLVGNALSRLFSLGDGVSGPLAFVLSVGGSWWILRVVKRRIVAWTATHMGEHERVGGAVAGGLRAALLALSAAGALALARDMPGRDAVASGSVVGRTAAWAVGGK